MLKQDFDRDGFVAIRSFLDKDEITELKARSDEFVEQVAPSLPDEIAYFEDKSDSSTLKQVQKLYEYAPYYEEVAKSDKVTGLAEELLGGPVILQNMQYFNKPAGIGKGTPPHQDGYYFMIRPQEAVTMWLSLGYADATNGAVCYIPGSQTRGMRPHGNTNVLGFSQGISDWSEDDARGELQMEAGPGDILVHHSLTIHRANANTSDRDRRSVGFIFYRADVVIDEDGHDAYQKQLDEDLKARGKI